MDVAGSSTFSMLGLVVGLSINALIVVVVGSRTASRGARQLIATLTP